MSCDPHHIIISPRYVGPCRRTDLRSRRREAQHLTTALASGRLGLTTTPRRRLADGGHLADEAALHWPRDYRAGSPAAALAATADPAIAADLARWMLGADYGGAARQTPVSVPLPDAAPRTAALVDMVVATLDRVGLAPRMLELRFNEAALMDRSAETLLCLSALRDLGIGIAMDGWGRRFGSLTILRDLPLTALRLDPAMTHDIGGAEEDAVVESIAQLAGRLGVQVVAQAVDGAARRDRLLGLGVDAGTGAFPAPPLRLCPARLSAPARR